MVIKRVEKRTTQLPAQVLAELGVLNSRQVLGIHREAGKVVIGRRRIAECGQL
jgi:hypothetical protein